jgi:hypothetical protein
MSTEKFNALLSEVHPEQLITERDTTGEYHLSDPVTLYAQPQRWYNSQPQNEKK